MRLKDELRRSIKRNMRERTFQISSLMNKINNPELDEKWVMKKETNELITFSQEYIFSCNTEKLNFKKEVRNNQI